jgi:starch-binding outer membrane protein, SusD/RagB family
MNQRIGSSRLAIVAAAALAAGLTAGCEVINPGPVGDEFIDLPASQAGFVNGSWERMNQVIGYGAYQEATPTREIFPGGQTGSYGLDASRQGGSMGGWTGSGNYNQMQQMRWIADEAIRRFTARGDVDKQMMAYAYITAGYALRTAGDFFCWGVIDSGPLISGSEYWKESEKRFTKALEYAADVAQENQIYAGRAQVRMSLKDWAGARADAAKVPTSFVQTIAMDFSQGGNSTQRNHVVWANADQPYRSWTVNYTFFHKYYTDTGDPRTPWRAFARPESAVCSQALTGKRGTVACSQQFKYLSQDDDIRIASGAEMRLIEAEAILRQTPANFQQAMTIINANRTRYVSEKTKLPLTPWVANNVDDAWTFLMRERGIELWLESRRFADMRRWEPYVMQQPTDGASLKYGMLGADGQTLSELPKTTPGIIDWPNFEAEMTNPTANLFTTNLRGRAANEEGSMPRELCYNISSTERQNNPNLNQNDSDITP